MKFIHTADWHLGKTLKGQPLIDEQIHILTELLKVIDDEKPEAVIIAGDVYDRSIPPVDAVNLFDEIIFKIVERKIPVLCISGNHDSAARLNFGSKLFERAKFFITTQPDKKPAPVVLSDSFGDVYFSLIPFFEPIKIQETFAQDADKLDGNTAVKIYVDEARKAIPAGARSVAVAHLFVLGGLPSESERKFVGAVENVEAANFAAYNYTALGHLHKPQKMAANVRYSGSLLKYSFDEANYSKGVTLVEMNGGGKVSAKHIDLKPRHDVKVIEGTVDELLKSARTEDYIHANLTDKNYVLYAMDKLRNGAFPNILSVKFINLERQVEGVRDFREGVSPFEHFVDFYKHETDEDLTGDYLKAAQKIFAEAGSAG